MERKKNSAIILAAGRGSRMGMENENKVVLPLAGKPMVVWTVERLREAGVGEVVVVIGFADESVRNALSGFCVKFVEQEELLGTGHAALVGLREVGEGLDQVVVLYGDQSAFFTPGFYKKLFGFHQLEGNSMTLVSTVVENPFGYGRIIRDEEQNVVAIVEQIDCDKRQRLVKEVNTGGFVFDRRVLEQGLAQIPKNEKKGEYYITDMVEYCVDKGLRVGALVGDGGEVGEGVNTAPQYELAKRLFEHG